MSQEPLPPSPSAPSPTTGEYEFSEEQNKVFNDLAENLSFFGWFVIIVIVIFHVVLAVRWATTQEPPYGKFQAIQVIWPILTIYVCAQFIRTSNAFTRVATTRGRDVTNLMDGLKTLNEGFDWITIFPRIWLLFVLIAAVIGAIIGIVHWMGY